MYRMNKVLTWLVLVALLVSAFQPVVAQSPPTTAELPEGGAIAQLNDIEMYYEIYGEGEPLLLMHSVTGSMAQFENVIPILAEEYQVIAVDFRGHGRTTDAGQPLSYELMASDMVALLDQLEIDAVHIVGNKDGGIIGLAMAMEHPERVKSLVAASVNWSPAGFHPWFVDYVKGATLENWDAMTGEMYRTVAPDPSIMPVMLEKVRNLLLMQPNFTLEQLGAITTPVLVLAGADEEVLKIGHVEHLAAALPDASLVWIEDAGHGVLDEQFDAWMDAVDLFLRGELDAPPAGKYAAVNDIQMYYEIHGEGEPLLFMPSGMWSTENFAGLTAALAEEYQVIVMDARGRGRSTDSGRRLDIAVMADDVVALMGELGIETAHVVGWADSAIVGLEMAMRYPERVDRLVAYAPNYTVEGLTEEHRAWLKSLTLDDMAGMFEEGYARIAPNPEYLPVILERVRAMFLTEPNYTLDQLGEITAPTLVLDGEEDEFIVREHLEAMAAAIPNAELAFLPGLSHYAPFEDPAAWTAAVLEFLAEPAAQAVPRFEPSECKYPILADADAECGYLVVREERSNPDSPTIRVHVIKFRSASETPAPDPVVVIPGGPGAPGSFYAWLWAALPVGDVMRAERDVYLLETRGAMYSEPAFYCPETEADAAERVGMGFAEEMEWLAEAYRACHDRLVAEGANFSAYGLPDIAGDVADLRAALGIDQVNVYGVSYGTPPAMLLMRDDPAWVR
ncbi:MAG: alpha/beta fold hydrolase, partial [Caldilineaceae bacterium]|nr:alpha/beta fold hydrolase [Caldilineaceae bacterium]